MIAIVDYGVGNLYSLARSFDAIGAEVTVTADPKVLQNADKILLPGVGAFGDAAEKLRATGLDRIVVAEANKGKPLMGICLGMQLLFDEGFEYGCHKGLGLIPGKVVPIANVIPEGLKIPHMGWNDLTVLNDCPLSADVADGDYVYYVHSYRADTSDEYISCYTMYNEKIPGLVYRDNVYGAQFHPEKSGQVGMNILKNFAKLVSV